MKKTLCLLFTFIITCMTMSVTAFADMGPKPSVVVSFKNLGNEECYCTLLSAGSTTGPYSAWEGDKPLEGIDGAFNSYKDKDGYYYLMYKQQVSSSKRFVWDYYPPSGFKILLYYPAYDLFLVSEKCNEYAFSSYFSVDMSGIDPARISTGEVTLRVNSDYNYVGEFIGFALRVIFTLFIEITLAADFINKRRFRIILITNLATQLGLNLVLNIFMVGENPLLYYIYYIGIELAIGIIEMVVYLFAINTSYEERVSTSRITVYALSANFVSFMSGILIAVAYRLIAGLLGIEMISPII